MLAAIIAFPASVGDTDDASASGRGAGPLDKLAGLSLVQRTALTLQKEGAERIVLLIRPGMAEVAEHLRGDERLKIETSVVEVSPSGEPSAALGAALDEPFLLCRYDVVIDPKAYRQLLDAGEGPELGWWLTDGEDDTGLLRGTPTLLEALASAGGSVGRQALDTSARRSLVQQGRLGQLPMTGRWWVHVDSPEMHRRAALHLFEDCRKSADGIVSRHLNRHVSLFLSKRLVNTPLSPNGATALTFLVALAAAGFAMRGGYRDTLIGASLMQLNSILDGVDGELARVRFQQSKLGQWLDTLGDDGSNVLFYAALAIGARQLPHGELLSTCGWVATIGTAVTAALYYVELVRADSGDLNIIEWQFDKQRPTSLTGWVLIFFRYVFKQDAFIFLLWVTAAAGVVSQLLPLWAFGAVATMIAAATRHLQPKRG